MVEEEIKVLIVDDMPMTCDVLETDLSERGYHCTSVGNGQDALIKISQEKFHVVLLDLMLGGGLSGLGVLREIGLRHNYLTTIIITGVNSDDVARATGRSGAVDYILKPFDLDEVDTKIRVALCVKQSDTG